MNDLSRRRFLKSGAIAAASVTMSILDVSDAAVSPRSWSIGCFNRPWMQKFGSPVQPLSTPQPANWGFDAALKGIKKAGFKTVGLLTPMPGEPFIGAEATDDYLVELKKKLEHSGLSATMGSLHTNFSNSLDDAIQQTRRQIDHAHYLDLEWLLTFGVDKKSEYENYYRVMADAADYAEARSLKLVLKPHGGGSGASEEILRCIGEVKRPNFKIWYDAGNIIYYTGKDPVEELKPIAQYARHWFLRQGLWRTGKRRHDSIRHRQSRFCRRLRRTQKRWLQWPDFYRMCRRQIFRRSHSRRPPQPPLPRKDFQKAVT